MIGRLLFGGEGGADRQADTGLLLLRLFVGLALAWAHGINKLPPSAGFMASVAALGFPAPVLFAWAAGIAEFVGGHLIALGLLTRPAALFVAITMFVAAFLQGAGDPFIDNEKPLVFLAVAVLLMLTGAGRYSVDAWLRGRRPVPTR